MFNMPRSRGEPLREPRMGYPRPRAEDDSGHEAHHEIFFEPEFLSALRSAGCRPTLELSEMRVECRQETPGGPITVWLSRREPAEQIQAGEAEEFLALKISGVVAAYISAVREAASPAKFRHEAELFARALSRFTRSVPDPLAALAYAIDTEVRKAEIAGQRISEGNDERFFCEPPPREVARLPGGGVQVRYFGECRMEDVLASLVKIQAAVEQIRRAEGGRGAKSHRAAHLLIERLALLYEEFTGKPVTRICDPYLEGGDAVKGPFVDFVRLVEKGIPKSCPLPDLGNLIRQYGDRTRV